MMRIGLLTFSGNTNYGSWCQAWALCKAVEELCGDCIEIIDYHYDESERFENVSIGFLLDFFSNWDGRTTELRDVKKRAKVQKGLNDERKKYWKLSNIRYTYKNISSANEIYDVFLIGADLVWDHRYGGASLNFYLDFAQDNKRKIAFSASSGYTNHSFGRNESDRFKEYLPKFDYIAVRENNLKKLISRNCNFDVPVVCDPTLLLDNSIWKSFVHKNNERKPYVLLYIVDDERMFGLARYYAKKHGFDVLCIGYGQPQKYVNMRQPINVSDWITLIYYAEKVFTGSYHGLLFSIYLKREFCFYRRRPLPRFAQLTEKLQIGKYEIHDRDFDVEKKIEWDNIKEKEEEYRAYSKKILKEALGEACTESH